MSSLASKTFISMPYKYSHPTLRKIPQSFNVYCIVYTWTLCVCSGPFTMALTFYINIYLMSAVRIHHIYMIFVFAHLNQTLKAL